MTKAVDQADSRPDQTQRHRAGFRVDPQRADGQCAHHRQDQVVERVLHGAVHLVADIELRDHRQVDEGEGHQRTEVDQRGRGHRVKRYRGQRDGTHQQHVQRRGTPLRMYIAEEASREHAVAAHHVHQTRNARMRRHARRQYRHTGEHRDHRLEELARHVQHDFRLRRVRILEARDVREVQLHEVRHHDKDDAADQRRQEDGFRDHFLRLWSLRTAS